MTSYYLISEDNTGDLAAMHEGTGTLGVSVTDDSAPNTFAVGTGYFDPDDFVSLIAFLEFDTTSVSVDGPTSLNLVLDYVSILDAPGAADDFVIRVTPYDWGGGIPTWLTPADLSVMSPVYGLPASLLTSGSTNNLALGTGVVNLGGITRLILYTDFQDADDTASPKTAGATTRSQYLVFDAQDSVAPILTVGGGGGGPLSYADEVLADSPVIYWRLDELSGTAAADSSGNSNDGTYVNSPTLGTTGLLEGSANTAVTLDRPTNQYVVQDGTLDAITYSEFSIEVILNAATDPVYFPSVAGVNGTNFDLMMLALNDNGVGAFVNWSANSSTSGWQATTSPDSILPGNRYHIIGTWDGSIARIYINGTQQGSTSSSESIEFGQVENFYAGSDQFGSAYDGILDEVALYSVALSPTRVTAHYTALLAGGEDTGGGGGGPSGPNITSMSENVGPAAGGTVVNIHGTNFTGATIVKFGTTNAASFAVNSIVSITATSPAHAAGLVDVAITTPDGVSGPSSADHFTFISNPVVTNLTPTTDTVDGGVTVDITGSQFTGATAVLFGTTPATSFTVLTDTTITAVAPAHISQTVNIRVTTASGTSPTGSGNQFIFGAGSGGGGTGGSGGGGIVVFDPVVRWIFLDTSDASTVTFEINPESGGTPGRSRKVVSNRLADNEQVLVYANSLEVPTWEISGTILTETMYNLILEWFSKRNPIEVTDDLGRTFTIMFTKFTAKREYKSTVPWFHSYDATALVLV